MQQMCWMDSAEGVQGVAAAVAIVREAARVGWPVRFASDVVHDQEALAHYEPATFGWVLHEHGTDLLLVEQLSEAIGCLRFWSRGGDARRLYLWERDRLVAVNDLATLEQRLLLAAAAAEAAA